MAQAPYGFSAGHYYSPEQEVYSRSMSDRDAILKGAMRDLGEASRRVRAVRHLMREHGLEDDPGYLRLVARLSEALDVTEAALREARRLRDTT
jgi:hypothetical protein